LFFLCAEDTIMSFMAICGGAIWTDCTSGEEERVKISRVEAVRLFHQSGRVFISKSFLSVSSFHELLLT